jgi:2-polyprenyl-6-methoxyphenol hydroxylase-like FAD-dependent oxidoreductase
MQIAQTTVAPKVLISGASFAGLAAALWMNKLGYRVTIVETGTSVKKGGTPVDIRDETIEIVERMGILEAIRGKSLPPRVTEFTSLGGVVDARIEPEPVDNDQPVDGYEIPRDDLLEILLATIGDDVEVLWQNSIATLTDITDGIRVTFRDGSEDDFAMVLGCDGNHSTVRKLRFGPEENYSRFLHNYFTVTVVDETLIEPNTTRLLNLPGRMMMLNSYENKTDIVFAFHSDEEISYDYHDVDEQRDIVRARFADLGAPFTYMFEHSETADNFYFDKLSQISMDRWTSGRVALVGDAGYCASPAAGMGGSLAITGATALFDALHNAGGDIEKGFAAYERELRPVVERIQTQAATFGVATYFPSTDEQIRDRNRMLTDS